MPVKNKIASQLLSLNCLLRISVELPSGSGEVPIANGRLLDGFWTAFGRLMIRRLAHIDDDGDDDDDDNCMTSSSPFLPFFEGFGSNCNLKK